MLESLRRRWFMVALLLLIPLGIAIGMRAEPNRIESFPKHIVEWASGGLTAIVLFLMSVTLETRKLVGAFRTPAAVVWATTVNFVVLPVAAIGMMRWQSLPDFAVGLMVTASVPSTLAAASVWTRKAGGNDAVSLLVTIITNGACFLVTPLWMKLGLSDSIQLNTEEMIEKLFYTALVPIALGQAVRVFRRMRQVADRGKDFFGGIAQGCILAIVFWASIQGGVRLAGSAPGEGIRILPVAIIWVTCIVLHLIGLIVAYGGGLLLRLPREDVAAVMFAGSQKTLPVGIFIAAGLVERGLPFAALPILMYHASQLVIDTAFVDRLRVWIEAAQASPAADSASDASS